MLPGARPLRGRRGRPRRHGAEFALAHAADGPPPRVSTTTTDTTRYGTARAQAWDRLHPRLAHRGASGHPGEHPIIEGTLIRLQVDRLPGGHDPKPLWLRWSKTDATPADVDRCWQAFCAASTWSTPFACSNRPSAGPLRASEIPPPPTAGPGC